ncbi:adenine phosphoribosyltransferase [Liquorilactobacillus sucicola DSM 21376 = JCM 15457]|uniref:Phosphoribosyl transferase domain protein n=1 Tax=Liquorilactobacillus sucicola DSM 21376 = JCM 15457 TaxID=1423806 RepID=A0A023CY09_9LACO|nr:phosphoribosyltransferase family protein [Liquorilactobacillus sucicola]KRN06931.1 phosphoribosyl transferase domain protein [Liquorilactobacillus sucicola DSM 21376 = JCM 15457]GAJ26410.1 adenine phosphoribosyltransferase [Liquorilactobacillus sucicola DSM 21376 = JCM 15457]
MEKYYELKIDDLTRKLPLIKLNDNVAIASFVLLGDAELTHYAAERLARKIDFDFDYLVTMESKGIPLAQEMCHFLKKPRYVVLRKNVKDYMEGHLSVAVNAITTSAQQQLVLDGNDAALLKGKKIVIIDDVISSGGSIAAAEKLMRKAEADVVDRFAILAEGDAAERADIQYLEKLPLFQP